MANIRDFWFSRKRNGGLSRRDWIRGSGAAAASLGFLGVAAPEASAAKLSTGADIYESIGVRPIINCKGTFTIISGSLSLPEVKAAMTEAGRHYVQMDELMNGVSNRLAEITQAPYGIVTAGCCAALTCVTAACIAGTDIERMQQLPNLEGLKSEVIIPDYSRNVYDHAIRMLGVKIITVKSPEEFQNALSDRTAMVYVLAGPGDDGPLGTKAIAGMVKSRNIPVLVDAAAENLTIPNIHLERGATVVAYSGGKCLRGPQCAGLALGDKNLLEAAWSNSAPHHAFGRSLKVGKEEIIGMLTAVEMWPRRDHKAEWAQWEGWLAAISNRVTSIPGVTTRVEQPDSLSNNAPSLRIEWDGAKLDITGRELARHLLDAEPRIAVEGGSGSRPHDMKSSIGIMPYMMMPGDEKIAAERIYAILTKPPKFEAPPEPSGTPANIAGRWDAVVEYKRGTAQHVLMFEQKGSTVKGTHQGELVSGDLKGTVFANLVRFDTAHRIQGTSIFYGFDGKVDGDTMAGTVNLGEYGAAKFTAVRHKYRGRDSEG